MHILQSDSPLRKSNYILCSLYIFLCYIQEEIVKQTRHFVFIRDHSFYSHNRTVWLKSKNDCKEKSDADHC